MVARNEIFVLDLDAKLRLPACTAGDEHTPPVPAIASLMDDVNDAAVEKLARVASLGRSIEKLKHSLDRIELGVPGGADTAANFQCVGDRVMHSELFHLPA